MCDYTCLHAIVGTRVCNVTLWDLIYSLKGKIYDVGVLVKVKSSCFGNSCVYFFQLSNFYKMDKKNVGTLI